MVALTGDVIARRRGRGHAAVTVQASLTDLLLVVYRRTGVSGDGIAVVGDADLLDLWLGHVGFG